MNYYIDFDNTLYETAKLTELMLNTILNTISQIGKIDSNILSQEIKENFNSTNDNIFTFATKMANKYKVDTKVVLDEVNNRIVDGESIVFEDAIRFLERLKENGHKVFLLTYVAKANQDYQMTKIQGSGLAKYFDAIIITTEYKFELDINYEKGIFIDDDPRDLEGLYNKKAFKVIRIRKENNKRSKIDIDNNNIEEYESFDKIKL